MSRYHGLGYKRMNDSVLHVYSECPEGSIIAIAKRDTVNTMDPAAMKDLVWCPWCQAQDELENPPRQHYGRP